MENIYRKIQDTVEYKVRLNSIIRTQQYAKRINDYSYTLYIIRKVAEEIRFLNIEIMMFKECYK